MKKKFKTAFFEAAVEFGKLCWAVVDMLATLVVYFSKPAFILMALYVGYKYVM